MSRSLRREIERLECENRVLREHLYFCGMKTARVRCSCIPTVPDCYGCIYGRGHESCTNCDGSGWHTILFDPKNSSHRELADHAAKRGSND